MMKKILEDKGKVDAKTFAEEYCKRFESIQEKIFSGEFMKWLSKFTNRHPQFSSESITYFEDATEEDKENGANVITLFELVEKYCKTHNIKPCKPETMWERRYSAFFNHRDYLFTYQADGNTEYYAVSYNDGQGGVAWISRLPEKKVKKLKSFVKIEDVIAK